MADHPDYREHLADLLYEAVEGLKALESIELTVSIDDDCDPASIEAAIRQVEEAIDAHIPPYADNEFLAAAADQVKADCRANILQQVAAHEAGRADRTLH